MLTGWVPFQGNSTAELLHKHVYARFDRPGKRVTEIPAEFDELVCKLLEKDPDKRPADALVLQRELEFIKKKHERRTQPTQVYPSDNRTIVESGEKATPTDDGPGPATLMSLLMREELQRQNQGGWLSQFINRPVILAALFMLVVGLIVWVSGRTPNSIPMSYSPRGRP